MHTDTQPIDDMDLLALDDLRHQLRLSKADLCRLSDLDRSAYTRWMRFMHGLPGGNAPKPRSLRAVREVLKARVLDTHLRPADHMQAA